MAGLEKNRADNNIDNQYISVTSLPVVKLRIYVTTLCRTEKDELINVQLVSTLHILSLIFVTPDPWTR